MKEYLAYLQSWTPVIAIFLIVYVLFLIAIIGVLFLLVKSIGQDGEPDNYFEEDTEDDNLTLNKSDNTKK